MKEIKLNIEMKQSDAIAFFPIVVLWISSLISMRLEQVFLAYVLLSLAFFVLLGCVVTSTFVEEESQER